MNDESERIDALATMAREAGADDQAAQSALWRAVFELEYWVFVPQGEPPNLQPVVGVIDDRPMVLAFTDATRARDAAILHGIVGIEDSAELLAIPPDAFTDAAGQYEVLGVFGLLVNEGENGFYAPLDRLEAIRRNALG
jgi:hypothetical protein